jgi:hypothetical protein
MCRRGDKNKSLGKSDRMRKTAMVKLEKVRVRAAFALVVIAFLTWGTGCNLSSGNGTQLSSNPTPTPTPSPTPSVSHSVDITWNSSSSTNLQGYKVYRSQISGGPYSNLSGTLGTSTLAFTDTAVLGGQSYFYIVTSIDVNGLESAPSPEVSATIPSP